MSQELATAIEQAADARRRLNDGWQNARDVWADQVAADFELGCWVEIEEHLKNLLSAAEELRRAMGSSQSA